jgi:protease I
LNEPLNLFRQEGYEVKIAATQAGECYGKLGKLVVADFNLHDVNLDDFDGLVFVGGSGATELINADPALNLAREAMMTGKIIGAICIAPSILAQAGLLKGKKVTATASEKESLIKAGAIFTGNEIEVDGNIVTASGPQAAYQFGETIASLLG